MNQSFLDNLSLATLVAPCSAKEFRTTYWEQQPLIIHRNDSEYYGELFTLADFDDAITRDPNYVKMANAESKKNVSYRSSSVQGLEAVLADMREGGTLVLDQMHHREPKLAALCRILAPEFGHRFQTNLYLTPPRGKGFTPHWDNHDVFILQVAGCKSWKVEKSRRAFPTKLESVPEEERDLRGDLYSFVLNQGDLIYIPRGYIHAAECGDEASLHITLGVTANFFDDLLLAAIKAKLKSNPRWREALPLGHMNAPSTDLVRRAMEAFLELADDAFLTTVVEEYRDDIVKLFPIDVSHQVSDFFRPKPIQANDMVGPRRGIVYRLHIGDDSVRLNFGTRSITFMGIFREALEFALRTPVFRIGDLPGDLQDVERVVFVERLMQEGLVIRK